jgi:hypothetical protein
LPLCGSRPAASSAACADMSPSRMFFSFRSPPVDLCTQRCMS